MGNDLRKSEGFTRTEFVTVLLLLPLAAFLVIVAMSSVSCGCMSVEKTNRLVCAANIRGIIQAMEIYAQSNHNTFPAVKPLPSGRFINGVDITRKWNHQTAGEIIKSYYRLGGKATQRGSPLACMWILVMQNALTPKSFICPSDPLATGPSIEYQTSRSSTDVPYCFGNFGHISLKNAAPSSGVGESYSIAYPWNGRKVGAWWKASNATASVPLVSDMAPAQDPTAAGTAKRDCTIGLGDNSFGPYIFNSGNHGGDGQNVGFGDDHVVFETNPYVGRNMDNIFTYGQRGIHTGGHAIRPGLIGHVPPHFSNTPPYDTIMTPVRDVATGQW